MGSLRNYSITFSPVSYTHLQTKGMTVFIVSQRATSIKQADKILVLDDGELAGVGTHKELMESWEGYREICLSQLSEQEVNR